MNCYTVSILSPGVFVVPIRALVDQQKEVLNQAFPPKPSGPSRIGACHETGLAVISWLFVQFIYLILVFFVDMVVVMAIEITCTHEDMMSQMWSSIEKLLSNWEIMLIRQEPGMEASIKKESACFSIMSVMNNLFRLDFKLILHKWVKIVGERILAPCAEPVPNSSHS